MGIIANVKSYINEPYTNAQNSQQDNNGQIIPNYSKYQVENFAQYNNIPLDEDKIIRPRNYNNMQPSQQVYNNSVMPNQNFNSNNYPNYNYVQPQTELANSSDVARYQNDLTENIRQGRYAERMANIKMQNNYPIYNEEMMNVNVDNHYSQPYLHDNRKIQYQQPMQNQSRYNPYQNISFDAGYASNYNNANYAYVNNGFYENYNNGHNFNATQPQVVYQPQMYQPVNYNNFNELQYQNHKANKYKNTTIIPTQIAKEIRAEKWRIILFFFLGIFGIVCGSIFATAYFVATKSLNLSVNDENALIWGMKLSSIPQPFFTITSGIVALILFIVSIMDYTFIKASVIKYEAQLFAGREQIPYFITKNYRNMISRTIILNWIAFPTYIFGAITLGILYGLQSIHESDHNVFYFGFWKIGEIPDMTSNITITTIVLFVVLGIQIFNIITTRSRKNNIISYYGYEILPDSEIRSIKKRTNRICMVIFLTIVAILLIAIIITVLLFRRKNKNATWRWPWQKAAVNV
ncbi:MSC_0882 family membrane protein [Spiroplasma endosymbiont of Labia minor]|uniref:MSC_0882 family membrane protein n=1 Tax=Spiroplasma endosymbiont of Labia minor TaxID=3066305 RepID=UPI0030CE7D5A